MRTINLSGVVAVPGSPANAYPDRRGYLLEGIVVHTMSGTLAGCDSWFSNPAAQAGTHFGVGRAGEVHQYFSEAQGPFAHGIIEAGFTARLVRENGSDINPNWYLAGIEHDDLGTGALPTDAQLEASARLAAAIWQQWIAPNAARTGAVIDRDHIIRHSEISPRSRPTCPGWPEGLLLDYVTRVQQLVGAPQPDERIGFEALWPVIQRYAAQEGADARVCAGIVAQESNFVNVRVHQDGTGHGLIGLDDNGLLPNFEQFSGLSVGQGADAAVIPVEPQVAYLAHIIEVYTRQYGDAFAAARAWHRGERLMNDERGRTYEKLIRNHIARLFPPDPPAPPEPVEPPVTMEGVQLGLIDKVIRKDWAALYRDSAKLAGK